MTQSLGRQNNIAVCYTPAGMKLMRTLARKTLRARRLGLALALAIGALAFAARDLALRTLPVDYDEPIYLSVAQTYAAGFQRGELGVLRDDAAPENPQLMKLLFGLAIAPLPDFPAVRPGINAEIPSALLGAARRLSVAFAAAQVFALALLNPLAGVFLALHSRHIQFTSEVMLEAVPALTSLLCVLAWQRSGGRPNRWLFASSVMLGLTAAGKYLYCLAGVAILVDAMMMTLRERRPILQSTRALAPMLAWGGFALAVFIAVSPALWADPIGRLLDSVFFHTRNSSISVNAARYVAEQPLAWLVTPVSWRPGAFVALADGIIAVLAALGAPFLWRRQRVFALWLGLGIVFLFLYANKWPQYALLVSAPLCLSAGMSFRWLLRRTRRAWGRSALLALPLLAITLGAVSRYGDLPANADPAFRDATTLIQQQMAPDEIAIAVLADPAVSGGALEPGWRSWNPLPASALAAPPAMLDYASAARLLNRVAAGRHGVWVLTRQRAYGDPADMLQTLLQRQTGINGPTLEREFERDYAVTHFRFDTGYAPIPEQPALSASIIEPGAGRDVSLAGRGCAQLRPAAAGGVLEIVCFWRSRPYIKLPWDTRARLRVLDPAGREVVAADPLIARSGFPWFHFEQEFAGVYWINLPASFAPGIYTLEAQPVVEGALVAPRVRAPIVISGR